MGQQRLVETPVKTKSCIYCRLCTSTGTLQEVLARKKDDNDNDGGEKNTCAANKIQNCSPKILEP